MRSWTLLLALFLALTFTNLVVLAREAEVEEEKRGGIVDDDNDIDDGFDDDDDILIKGAVHKAAGTVCRLFGDRNGKRDLLHIQKRGWFKKAWKKVKKTASKVWKAVKPHVIPAVIGAVTGKRDQLTDASVELDDEQKRSLMEFVREVSNDDSMEKFVRKRGWISKTWKKVKNGVKKVVNKVKDKIKDFITPKFPPHFPFPPLIPIGKRSELSDTEELDEDTRRALEEFTQMAARDEENSIMKRGKFWKKVKKFWKKVVKPILKKILRKRQEDEVEECDPELDEVRESLDVLYTVAGMVQDVDGCASDDDVDEGDDGIDDDGDVDDGGDADDDAL